MTPPIGRLAAIAPAAIVALVVVTGASAQATTPVDEVRDRLEAAAGLAELGQREPATDRMDLIRATLGLPTDVGLPGGTLSVEADPVLARLPGDDPADFRRAAARIDALEAALDRAGSVAAIDAGEVDQALDRAYAGSIQVDPGMIARIRRAIAELIQGFLSRLLSFSGAGTVVAWAVLVALVVLAIWLLARLRVPDSRLAAPAPARTSPRVDHVARAEEALRSGDLVAAIHAFYRGLLATLSGRGLLIDVPGLTAGECRTTVRSARPDLFEAVADATGTYERIVYGGTSPARRDVETLRRAVSLARTA